MPGCVALMYHVIGEPGADVERQWCVSPAAFRDQMRFLGDAGYNVVSMSQVVRWMEGRLGLPPNAVCITIDDGTRCILDAALPTLSELSLPAIAYVVSGSLGGWNEFVEPFGWSRRSLVGVCDVRTLVSSGVEIGSHSVSHADLAAIPPAQLHAELRDSRTRLESVLGSEIAHFAYPFGSLTRHVRDAAEAAGYRSACCVDDGRIHRRDDRFRLNRVEVHNRDSLDMFARKVKWAAKDPRLNVPTTRSLARRTLQRIGLYDAYLSVRDSRIQTRPR